MSVPNSFGNFSSDINHLNKQENSKENKRSFHRYIEEALPRIKAQVQASNESLKNNFEWTITYPARAHTFEAKSVFLEKILCKNSGVFLGDIFKYLSYKDLSGLSRSCKQAHETMREHMSIEKKHFYQKKYVEERSVFSKKGFPEVQDVIEFAKEYEITYLNLKGFGRELTTEEVEEIGNELPLLKGLGLDTQYWEKMLKAFPNKNQLEILDIDMEFIHRVKDELLIQDFASLKELSTASRRYIQGKSLIVCLSNEQKLNLEILSVKKMDNQAMLVMQDLVNLKTLHLMDLVDHHQTFKDCKDHLLKLLPKLKRLETLSLFRYDFNDSDIMELFSILANYLISNGHQSGSLKKIYLRSPHDENYNLDDFDALRTQLQDQLGIEVSFLD